MYTMTPRDEKSQRALDCFKLVKKTFIITFLLVFITTAIMYGTTQTMSIQASRVIESNFKPMAIINRTFLQAVFRREQNLNISVANLSSEDSQTNDEYPQKLTTEPKPARFEVPNPALIAQLDASLNKKIPGKVTSLVRLKPGDKESVEFPGMPDPCQLPRRNTGVEDVLCMVRVIDFDTSIMFKLYHKHYIFWHSHLNIHVHVIQTLIHLHLIISDKIFRRRMKEFARYSEIKRVYRVCRVVHENRPHCILPCD